MKKSVKRQWFIRSAFSLVALCASAFSANSIAQADPQGFPGTIALPAGWQPEGITSGPSNKVFVGSLAPGSIYSINVKTGAGSIAIQAPAGRSATGLKWDKRTDYLYVAGASTGMAYVYDITTGTTVAALSTDNPQGSFVNDVVITDDAVYFTESFKPQMYRLSLGCNGQLDASPELETIPLSGDFTFVPDQFNINGVVASPDGRSLIMVSSILGVLYRVNPKTGSTSVIDLGGGSVPNGDGLLRNGQTLYVVENFSNLIQTVHLGPGLTSGTLGETLTNPSFDIPTTIARVGGALYAVNSRFATPPLPDTTYDVVRVPLNGN